MSYRPQADPTKRPVICLATIDWHFLFQRHQHLMSRLAAIGFPVYFVNATQIPGAVPERISANLMVYSDSAQIPWQVKENAIYFVYHPANIPSIPEDQRRFIIYDCVDDFPEFEIYELQAIDRSNLIISSSQRLFEKHQGRHPHLLHVPNGVQANHFQKQIRKLPPQMVSIRDSNKPVIGFAGAMFHGWVDIDLLYYLAQTNPEWQIVIVGESYGWDFSKAPFNLFYLGRKSYDHLPNYMAGFDIAIIPFLDNQISQGTDPIKLYEYMAAGLPVVSRRLPFTERFFPPLVYSYDTKDECCLSIKRALSEMTSADQSARSLRLQFAAENSWDNRVRRIINKLRELTWLDAEGDIPVSGSVGAAFIVKSGIRQPMTVKRIAKKAGSAALESSRENKL